MAIFKELVDSDIKTQRSYLSQLIDVLQEDVSGSVSRRKYQLFVTGGIGPGVTSSLYQTVYDQDFTLQTANPVFDLTFGLNPTGPTATVTKTGTDAAGKELFPSSSLMMREKLDIYRQYAKALLGDVTNVFVSPFDSTTTTDQMDAAMFMSFKRLFARDQIKRETFAMKFYPSGSAAANNGALVNAPANGVAAIYTDVGSSTNKLTAFGGQVGNIVDSANTGNNVGLMFYDRGIAVFDLTKITSSSQFTYGSIDAMSPTGRITLGATGTETYNTAKFIPDFITSASIDNVIDHLAGSRFSSGSSTAVTFQNQTNINSTLIFCRAAAEEFNYSANPTYIDADNRIVVVDPGSEDTQTSFTYVTGVGLYDANDNLLAVAKLSRPVEKSAERDLTLRIRIDF